ncbi:ubiquinol-cytochrome c reductase complex assembly factor 4 [Hyperolius riggenbachi]|uniref:ubiquinol-cytochrome c reductase complex assembly factor 4 n=1 Tax=Hyperolius riggenbachi TaxID=752182 RepID=UPI0035A29D89
MKVERVPCAMPPGTTISSNITWKTNTTSTQRLRQSFVAAFGSRMLHEKKPPESPEEDLNKPLKFSTGKGSHHHWTVEQSFGSDHQQPVWKAMTVSLTLTALVLWIFFRKENELDQKLLRPVSELLEELEQSNSKEGKDK